jgi:hypothetical protein
MDTSRVPLDIVESTLLGIFADPLEHLVVMTFRTQARECRLRAQGVEDMLVNESLQRPLLPKGARSFLKSSRFTAHQ